MWFAHLSPIAMCMCNTPVWTNVQCGSHTSVQSPCVCEIHLYEPTNSVVRTPQSNRHVYVKYTCMNQRTVWLEHLSPIAICTYIHLHKSMYTVVGNTLDQSPYVHVCICVNQCTVWSTHPSPIAICTCKKQCTVWL